MADQKLTQRDETIQSDNESLIHVVKDGVSYHQTKANFLADVAGYSPVSNVSAIWNNALIFDVTADLYPVAGGIYSSTAGQVTLNEADGVFDRIDLIVAIAPVSPATVGTVGKITGIPATTELVVPPDYDPTLVYVIKQVIIKAATGVPYQTANETVFDEGTEWAVTYPPSYALVTDDFSSGAKSIYATSTTSADKLLFTSASPLDSADVDLVDFYIKLNDPNVNFAVLNIGFKLAGEAPTVNQVYITKPVPNDWERIQFTKEQLNLGTGTYDEIVVFATAPSSGTTFWIDNIRIHKGSGAESTNLNISQFINDVPYAKLSDLTGNDYSEWADYSGTRVGNDLLVILGDYDISADGTRIEINDLTAEINNIGYTTSSQGFGVLSGSHAFNGSLLSDNITSSTTVQLPDASGTLALEADASGFNGNLTPSDNTLQAVAQKFDDYVATVDGYVTLAGDNVFTGTNQFQGIVEIDNGSEGANAGLGMSGHKIQYLADGVIASDAVNKGQLDAVTPYQTPTDLLTAIKTVDGTGSGLDADFIDGLDSSRFIRSDANDSANGDLIFGGEAKFNGDVLIENADGIDLGGGRITTLGAGVASTDAVNKGQLDATIINAVTKAGTPLNNQLAVWTGDGTVEGDSNFTWDGNSFLVEGSYVGGVAPMIVIPQATIIDGVHTGMNVKMETGQVAGSLAYHLTGNGTTWSMLLESSVSGSNNNFHITNNYGDSGSYFKINGLTDVITLPKQTIALIDADTSGKAITTKEWVQAQDPRPYKVYTALISQSGTTVNSVTAIVLENTLGGVPVWTRNSVGSYTGTLASAFTADKTTVFTTRSITGGVVGSFYGNWNSTSTVILSTGVVNATPAAVLSDDQLNGATIEIRVYN